MDQQKKNAINNYALPSNEMESIETMFPRLKKVNDRMQPKSSRLLKRLQVLGQERHRSGEV